MHLIRIVLFVSLVFASYATTGWAQAAPLEQAPPDRLLTDEELLLLDADAFPAAEDIRLRYRDDPIAAMEALAARFRESFAERYYFDWRTLEARFTDYRDRFPSREEQHRGLAEIHAGLYPADARWKLPYRNLKGDEVTAYELRHLARQHKVLDMAFVHHYEGGAPEYVDYFTTQMRSLNRAFESGEFEDDEGGNGVYESFRAGYRVINWFRVHAFFLGSEYYRWQDQVEFIRTMLHTGAVLHGKNRKFRYGNHQTRGAVALAMIAILLRDFAGTDEWYRDAMAILGEHLEKEVNPDGFQFERSIHYHIGDIFNFFQVLQLAQLNDFPVPEDWRAKLKAMFEAAVVLARPDRTLPVFQDDTDRPWAEYNEMGDFMLLGAILFDDPVINYFAGDRVASAVYWLLRDEQIAAIKGLDRDEPDLLSAELPDTGYYVMREGWDEGDFYMAVTAGLSEHKPDHQHGDMLGIVARANGQEILPNYQVRYSLPDFEFFKNSLVKNVALVDGIPHGIGWKSNRGGSGFGKWESLPQPSVIAWVKQDDWDFFAGTHDGYLDRGVAHFRKVFFLKGFGWIVRDLFESSSGAHDYQQVWQGHYSDEGGGNHHRSAFADGSGLEILQLGGQADGWSTSVRRGKGNLVYTMNCELGEYTTLLYPYRSFSTRIPQSFFDENSMSSNGWSLRIRDEEDLEIQHLFSDAALLVGNAHGAIFMNATRIEGKDFRVEWTGEGDVHLSLRSGMPVALTWLGHTQTEIDLAGEGEFTLEPGEIRRLQF